jgi:hypothetical protein
MPLQIEIDTDIAAFINRLEKFDKEVSKELKKNMRAGAKHVVDAARQELSRVPDPPLSNWAYSWVEQDRTENVRNLVYSAAKAKSGLKVATFRARRRGRTVGFGYQAVQKDPAASIFELAGTRNAISTATRAGSYTFNANINRRYKRWRIPRLLYPAYYVGMPKAREEMQRALTEARRRVGL